MMLTRFFRYYVALECSQFGNGRLHRLISFASDYRVFVFFIALKYRKQKHK